MLNLSKHVLVAFLFVLLCPSTQASLATFKAQRAHHRAQRHHAKELEVGITGAEDSSKDVDDEKDDEEDDAKDDEEDDAKDDENGDEKDDEKKKAEEEVEEKKKEEEKKEAEEEKEEKAAEEEVDPEKMKLEDELQFVKTEILEIQATKASLEKKTYIDQINSEASAVSAETETSHLGSMLGSMRSDMWTFVGPFWLKHSDKVLQDKLKYEAEIKKKLANIEAKKHDKAAKEAQEEADKATAKADAHRKKHGKKPLKEEEEEDEEEEEKKEKLKPEKAKKEEEEEKEEKKPEKKKKKTEAPPPKPEPKVDMGPFYFVISATIVYIVGLIAARLVDKRLTPKRYQLSPGDHLLLRDVDR